MFTLSEFTQRLDEAREFLEEKLIQYNNGKKYGQVVFIAGGAGSGKGFAISQFMEGEKFKIRDVDEMKLGYIKLGKLKNKFPEIQGLKLSAPEDVRKLHEFVKDRNIKDKSLDLLLKNKEKGGQLPNILFDITAKGIKDITKVIPLLEAVGYKARDIHLTWVLTNYKVAMKNNAGRERVVPEDILLLTHAGAANTMTQIITKNAIPRSMVDGGIYVVLNNRENTVVWGKDDKAKSSKDARKASVAGKAPAKGDALESGDKKADFKFIVKSFSYLTMKRPGKAAEASGKVLDELGSWVKANAPQVTK